MAEGPVLNAVAGLHQGTGQTRPADPDGHGCRVTQLVGVLSDEAPDALHNCGRRHLRQVHAPSPSSCRCTAMIAGTRPIVRYSPRLARTRLLSHQPIATKIMYNQHTEYGAFSRQVCYETRRTVDNGQAQNRSPTGSGSSGRWNGIGVPTGWHSRPNPGSNPSSLILRQYRGQGVLALPPVEKQIARCRQTSHRSPCHNIGINQPRRQTRKIIKPTKGGIA